MNLAPSLGALAVVAALSGVENIHENDGLAPSVEVTLQAETALEVSTAIGARAEDSAEIEGEERWNAR